MVISPIPPQLKFFQPGTEVLRHYETLVQPFFKPLLLLLILCIRSCLLKCTEDTEQFPLLQSYFVTICANIQKAPNIKCLVGDFSSDPDQYFHSFFFGSNLLIRFSLDFYFADFIMQYRTQIPKYRMCLEMINILYILVQLRLGAFSHYSCYL